VSVAHSVKRFISRDAVLVRALWPGDHHTTIVAQNLGFVHLNPDVVESKPCCGACIRRPCRFIAVQLSSPLGGARLPLPRAPLCRVGLHTHVATALCAAAG